MCCIVCFSSVFLQPPESVCYCRCRHFSTTQCCCWHPSLRTRPSLHHNALLLCSAAFGSSLYTLLACCFQDVAIVYITCISPPCLPLSASGTRYKALLAIIVAAIGAPVQPLPVWPAFSPFAHGQLGPPPSCLCSSATSAVSVSCLAALHVMPSLQVPSLSAPR